MEYTLENLILEVTRDCQLKCPHCLRGAAQKITMTRDVIAGVLQDIDYISSVTFSGGEPSLAPEVISNFIARCRINNVSVGNFYIATNGLTNPNYDSFMRALIDLYLLCDDNEVSSVTISQDQYHPEVDVKRHPLQVFKFFHPEERSERIRTILNEGRGKRLKEPKREVTVDPITVDPDSDYSPDSTRFLGDIYVNALGYVVQGCDWSYKTQEKIQLGDLTTERFIDILKAQADKNK